MTLAAFAIYRHHLVVRIDWGSVPDCLAGIGTVAATWFIVIQLRWDSKRAHEDRDEIETTEARLIQADGPSSTNRVRRLSSAASTAVQIV
jgi:hypothetical protein